MDKNSITNPEISVCIANYNGEAYISECIDSVLNQTINQPVEIIVHDDASSDQSVSLIQSRYPQVKLIKSDINTGYCKSNNTMADAATGKYIVFLNNDAQLFPDALQTLFNYSAGNTESADQNSYAILGLPQYEHDSGQLLDAGSRLDFFANPVPNQDVNKGRVTMVIGACLWIPRSLWRQIGGFPEWFESLAEDMFLCLAAQLMGHPVIVMNHSGFSHYVGKTLGGGTIRQNQIITTYNRRQLSERNKCFVMISCYPAMLLYTLFPLHLLLLYLEGLLLTLLKRDLSIWGKIYGSLIPSLWQRRKELIALRRSIQQRRKLPVTEFISLFSWFPFKLKILFKHGLPSLK